MVITLFYLLNGHFNEFKKILDLSIYQLLVLSSVTIISIVTNGALFKTLLMLFGTKIELFESIKLTIINNCFSYLIARGGQVARGVYLKTKYNFFYKNYILLLIIMNLMIVFAASAISIFVIIFTERMINCQLLIFFVFFCLLSILPFALPKRILEKLIKKNTNIYQIFDTWIRTTKNKRGLILPLALSAISIFLFGLRIYLIYFMIFEPILFSSTIVISVFGTLSSFVSITPAALGIKEGLMSYAATLAGEGFATAVAVASLDRIISMFWFFSLGMAFTIPFIKINNFKTLIKR